MANRILYITDQYKVSRGYEPAFTRMLNKAGIRRQQIILADIYKLVDSPLMRKGNEKTWRFNPEKKDAIKNAFDLRISAVRPDLIVVSDPAVLGILVDWDWNLATLDKCRGGVYNYRGTPVIVTYPITVINTHVDESLVHGEDDENKQQPYRVKSGAWILQRDWEKVGRYCVGKQRRLPAYQYSVCRTIEDCIAAREWLRNAVIISTDIETGCAPPQITCCGYTGLKANGACRTFIIPFFDLFQEGGVFWDSSDDHATAWSIMRDINALPVLKVMQNGSYDSSYFIRDYCPPKAFLIDSMLLWYSMYMELPKSLDFIASILLDNFQYWKDDIKGIDTVKNTKLKDVIPQTSMEKYWRYNGLDTYNTLFTALYMMRLMNTNPTMQRNYQDVFLRMLSGLAMSMRGVKADFKRREEHRVILEKERDDNIRRLRYMLGEPEFNINSPVQKADLLYNVFGLRPRTARGRFVNPAKPLKGTNAPSAGAWPLKMAKSEHPLFRKIIEVLEAAMEPDTQMGNVTGRFNETTGKVEGGLKLYTDRFRTAYGAAGTETTRLNSKGSAFWDGGNAQNIRETMRDWLVADDGQLFLDADYSQSDDVFIAYESQDPDKIALVESGLDGHAVHGELFFKRPYAWIVEGKERNDPAVVHNVRGVRQISKQIVHAANFLMHELTLYMKMGREAVVAAALILGYHDAESWSQDKLVNLCGRFLKAYRNRYKRLNKKEWYSEVMAEIKEKATLTNCFGITRRFLGDPTDSGTEREAAAFIGQSATAGNMNRTQNEIDLGFIPQRFRDGLNHDRNAQPLMMDWRSHGFAFHLQTHDSFTTQLNPRHPRWKEAAHNLLHVMNRPVIIHGREVRVRVETGVSLRWSHAEAIKWDGKDPYDLDRIATSLLTSRKKEAA